MKLAEFQAWLNVHGANLVMDGKGGPETRKAILATFANLKADPVKPQDINMIAARLGGSPKQVAAVAKVESGGGAFFASGHPKALYERHYFFKRWQIKIPFLSDPAPGGYTMDADGDGINDSWEKIADAAMRSPIPAFESASFGKFQIMGAWAQKMGYANAIEFAYALSRSETAHYDALARYIERFGLVAAFRAISSKPDDCRAFAKGYNGAGYAKFDYHIKIAEAMR